jgi:chaperonin GroEL
LLTTEVMVAEAPKEEAEHSHGPGGGGMGGMGGMDM